MKTFIETALELLRKAAEQEGNQRKLAERAGVNPVTLSRWIAGSRTPKCDELGKVFDVLGISLSEPGVDTSEYIMVPKVDAKAGAGSSLVTDGAVRGYYAFRLQFLLREGISTDGSVLLDVSGNSMSPLIQNMDTILVDQTQREPKDGGIFLVGFGDELLVKRLQRTARGWLLVSQNTEYEPIHVEGSDMDNFRVYGRVRWFGRVV